VLACSLLWAQGIDAYLDPDVHRMCWAAGQDLRTILLGTCAWLLWLLSPDV